jgi:phytoene synthase
MIERGSKSFALASLLFDEDTRESAHLLYAWCRYCDDVIDGQELGFRSGSADPGGERARLDELTTKTHSALAGKPTDEPIFLALSRVVARHGIPHRHPLELLEGFGMDVEGASYPHLEDTLRYCYHVAGVVGVMMAYIMGVRDAETLNRASDLGIALQLTNIARDVVEDAQMGRIYLPSDWLAEAGVSRETVLDAALRTPVFAVVERLLTEADRYYRSGEAGLTRLPLRSAWAIATASAVYREIGRIVRKRGPRAWDERAVVSKVRKVRLALTGAGRAVASRTRANACPREDLWTKPNLGT